MKIPPEEINDEDDVKWKKSLNEKMIIDSSEVYNDENMRNVRVIYLMNRYSIVNTFLMRRKY